MKYPQKLRIRTFGDDILRAHNEDVTLVDDALIDFAESMIKKMYALKGIGLAAPQVGVNIRMIVIDPPTPEDLCEEAEEDGDPISKTELSEGEKFFFPQLPVVLLNPKVVESSADMGTYEEGCLSVPKVYGAVTRPNRIKLYAKMINGEEVMLDVGGFTARVLQHEIDHLNGIVFADRFSPEVIVKNQVNLERLERDNQLEKLKRILKKK